MLVKFVYVLRLPSPSPRPIVSPILVLLNGTSSMEGEQTKSSNHAEGAASYHTWCDQTVLIEWLPYLNLQGSTTQDIGVSRQLINHRAK